MDTDFKWFILMMSILGIAVFATIGIVEVEKEKTKRICIKNPVNCTNLIKARG